MAGLPVAPVGHPVTHAPIWPVLAISGTLGFLSGALIQPTWQDVIEPAQVLAGVVRYAPDNPVYLYSTRTWTLMHQLVALAIAAGLTERTLAILISGGVGALSFQALALTSRAMGAPTLIAAVCPAFIDVSGATRLLPGYPAHLLGWPYTYGLVAHGWILLLLALLGLRRDRAAALMLGVFPAIHPGVGIWAWLIVAILGVVYRNTAKPRALLVRRWFAGGIAVALVSGAIHLWWVAPGATMSGTVSVDVLQGIRRYWDTHRLPLDWTSPSVIAAVVLPMVFVVWQRRLGRRLPAPSHWIATGLLIGVLIAIGADIVVGVVPESIGAVIARPMAGRLLSLPVLGAMAWVIGVCSGPTAPAALRAVTGSVFAALALAFLPPLAGVPIPQNTIRAWVEPLLWSWVRVAGVVLGLTAAAVLVAHRLPLAVRRWCEGWPQRAGQRVWSGALLLLAIFIVAEAALTGRANQAVLRDRHNDAVLALAAGRPGLLLTAADLHLIQAATRRPILFDGGAIDALVYVPAGAMRSERIMQRVYGLTLTLPASEDWGPDGSLPPWAGEEVWHVRTLEDWQAIGEEFGITDVLTTSAWVLHLPLVARDDQLALWSVPAR